MANASPALVRHFQNGFADDATGLLGPHSLRSFVEDDDVVDDEIVLSSETRRRSFNV